tara:strand:- start:4585 stop:8457 length:3873 start_codon:yes stop_codon:yes gene_type:complete
MPVIREKKNFSIGPVGVTRASEAGRITGQAITQSANQIGSMLFEKAAKKAEEFGLKEGASVDREQVIAINPQTGEPEAYEPPQGLGSIGADAYQRVVMTRFQRSIEDEIRNKGQELAVRFEDNANGVALYTSAMSDYISSMTDVAQDEFKGYIADVGTTYLNATRTSMAATQVRRERAAAARAQRLAIAEGLRNEELLAAQGGPAAFLGPTVANAMSNQVGQSIGDLRDAGLSSVEDDISLSTAQLSARARGYLQFYSNNPDTPIRDLNSIQAAFATQSVNLIPDGYPELRQIAEGLSAYPDKFRAFESFSDGLLSETITYRQGLIDDRVARIEAEDAQTAQSLALETEALNFLRVRTNVSGESLDVAVPYILNQFDRATNLISNDESAGLVDSAAQRTVRLDNFVTESVTALAKDSLVGYSSAQIEQLQQAIISRNNNDAPASAIPFLEQLIHIEGETDIPLMDLYSDVAQEYKSRAAGTVDSAIAEDAARQAAQDEIANNLNLFELGEGFTPYSERRILSDVGVSSVIPVEEINREQSDLTESIRGAIEAGDTELADLYTNQRNLAFDSAINRMAFAAVQGLSTDDTNDVFDALSSDNPEDEINDLKDNNIISDRAANAFIAAIRAGEDNGRALDVKATLESAINGHRSEGAAGVDADEERQADSLVESISEDTIAMSVSSDLSGVADIEAQIEDLEKLNPDAAATLLQSLNTIRSKLGLTSFFSDSDITDNQSILASMVLNGLDSARIIDASRELRTELSPEQTSFLEGVRETAINSGNPKEIIATEYNRLNEIRSRDQAAQQKLVDERALLSDVFTGIVPSTSTDSQAAVQDFFNQSFPNVSNFRLLTDFQYASEHPQALRIALTSPVLPSSTVGLFEQIGGGRLPNLNGSQIEAILSNWDNISTVTKNGQELPNPSVQAVSAGSRAVLDYLIGTSMISGTRDTESFLQAYQLYEQNSTDSARRDRMNEYLGVDSLEEFVIDQFDADENYNTNMYAVVENVALAMYSTGASKGDIEDAIARQLDISFQSGEGIVFGDGMASRTEHALSVTVPYNQNIFVDVLSDRISSATGVERIQIGDKTFMQSIVGQGVGVGTGGEGIVSSSLSPVLDDPMDLGLEIIRATPLAGLVPEREGAPAVPPLARFFLRPSIQKSDSGAIGYAVYRMPEIQGTGNKLVYEDFNFDPRPDDTDRRDTIRRPMVIYTDDPAFVSQAEVANAQARSEYLQRGELSRDYSLNALQEAIAGTPLDRRETPVEVTTPGYDATEGFRNSVGSFLRTHLFSSPYRD